MENVTAQLEEEHVERKKNCNLSLWIIQPRLGDYSSISFVGLQGAKPLFLNPIAANTECNGVKRKAGLSTSKHHRLHIS